MEEVRLLRQRAFSAYENVLHTGREYRGSIGFGYRLYWISEYVAWNDAVTIVYGDSIKRDMQNKREVLLDDLNPSYMSSEKQGPTIGCLRARLMCGLRERGTKLVL